MRGSQSDGFLLESGIPSTSSLLAEGIWKMQMGFLVFLAGAR